MITSNERTSEYTDLYVFDMCEYGQVYGLIRHILYGQIYMYVMYTGT